MRASRADWPRKTRELQNVVVDSTRWNDFEFRDDDIVIGTWSKSGTTLTQQIVAQLIFGGAPDVFGLGLSPWIEFRLMPDAAEVAAAQPHRRMLKTHLPLDALVLSPRAKYIYVGRDARDVVWSMHHHHSMFTSEAYEAFNSVPDRVGPPFEPPNPDIRAYYHEWLDRDGHPFWPFWSHVQSWWNARALPNVLLVHFENLRKDLAREVRRIAAFLEIDVDERSWPKILEHCSLEHVRSLAAGFDFLQILFQGGGGTFINKLVRTWLLIGFGLLAAHQAAAQPGDAELTELTALELQARLAAGAVSAERVASAFLARIEAFDDSGPALRAVIELNPDALSIARDLDRSFGQSGVVGPLHGLPVLIKANIDTGDRMATSAGSLALAGHRAAADAPLVARLRRAGAVILGKTNLSEWANFRSTRSTSGWSSLGGQTRNPYVLDRNPCGSSSGAAVAVAARLVPLAVGTETDGSIVCPAGANGVVGVKPTIGSVSARGIIPIAPSQDTAGPLARTVPDAALLLAAMLDTAESAAALRPPAPSSRTDLRGLRIGVVRDYTGASREAELDAAYSTWAEQLGGLGAELVDPIAVGLDAAVDAAELEVLSYEFREHIGRYLETVVDGPRSLGDLIRFNAERSAEVMPHFDQDLLLAAFGKGDLDDAGYETAVADSIGRVRGVLERLFAAQRLDALVAPANGRAWRTDFARGDAFSVGSSSIAAVSGYPSIAVPAAVLRELPVGIVLIGRPRTEPLLLEMAAVFERARGEFPAPRWLPSITD